MNDGLASYQDLLLPDGVEVGERACAERWEMLQEHIPHEHSVLDVGSNLGYYALQIALRPAQQGRVLSLEGDAPAAARQLEAVRAHASAQGLDAPGALLTLVEGHLDVSRAEAVSTQHVGTTLLLSVVHWLEDPERVLRALSMCSEQLIVELVDPADDACGADKRKLWEADPEGWLAAQCGARPQLLGRPGRQTSAVNSWLYRIDTTGWPSGSEDLNPEALGEVLCGL